MLGKQLHVSAFECLLPTVTVVENDPMRFFSKKPLVGTGLWTSSWREETQDSEWVEWCCNNDIGFLNLYWHLLTPKEDAKIIVIDTYQDLEQLVFAYGKSMKTVIFGEIFHPLIDFEKMAKDYDALHLTTYGAGTLHLSFPNDMNSWDIESTLWFRWCFQEVNKIEDTIFKTSENTLI